MRTGRSGPSHTTHSSVRTSLTGQCPSQVHRDQKASRKLQGPQVSASKCAHSETFALRFICLPTPLCLYYYPGSSMSHPPCFFSPPTRNTWCRQVDTARAARTRNTAGCQPAEKHGDFDIKTIFLEQVTGVADNVNAPVTRAKTFPRLP